MTLTINSFLTRRHCHHLLTLTLTFLLLLSFLHHNPRQHNKLQTLIFTNNTSLILRHYLRLLTLILPLLLCLITWIKQTNNLSLQHTLPLLPPLRKIISVLLYMSHLHPNNSHNILELTYQNLPNHYHLRNQSLPYLFHHNP